MARTVAAVRTPGMRRQARENAEKQLRLALYRMLATVVMLRHACGIVAVSGSAGWWLTALCALPGFAVYGLMRFALRAAGVKSVPALAAKCFGFKGMRMMNAVPAAVLAVEGAASLTALTTVFTDGAMTAVSAWMFALSAAAVLCLCTGRDGLVHGTGLLRWVLGAFTAAVLTNMLLQAQADHLFPLGGNGASSWIGVLRTHRSMAWPVLLLLWEEPPEGSGRRVLLPVTLTVAFAAVLCLMLPHEALIQPRTMAESMLLPGAALHPVNRMLLMCLWTAGLALSALIAAVRTADLLMLRPLPERWLPCALLIAFAALQLLDGGMLHGVIFALEGWLLVPFAALAAVLPIYARRRRKAP